MIAIIIGLLILFVILAFVFGSLGWVAGMIDRSLNEDQRLSRGIYITLFFIFMVGFKTCQWSNGQDRLEEKRKTVWRTNIPQGYYNINSSNFGNDEAIDNNYNINQMNKEIEAYDDKMARETGMWILIYIALVVIGFCGMVVYPLD